MAGFWYLASPYSLYEDGLEEANALVCAAAAYLIEKGIRVFCPIAHSHAICEASELDPLDHNIWMFQDAPFCEAAMGLIVFQLPGWERSAGVTQEIEYFEEAHKPIVYLTVEQVLRDDKRALEDVH